MAKGKTSGAGSGVTSSAASGSRWTTSSSAVHTKALHADSQDDGGLLWLPETHGHAGIVGPRPSEAAHADETDLSHLAVVTLDVSSALAGCDSRAASPHNQTVTKQFSCGGSVTSAQSRAHRIHPATALGLPEAAVGLPPGLWSRPSKATPTGQGVPPDWHLGSVDAVPVAPTGTSPGRGAANDDLWILGAEDEDAKFVVRGTLQL